MPLTYNQDQLLRESQLLLTEVCILADAVIAEGAGIRALGLDPDNVDADRRFVETRHPDDLIDLDRFDVWHSIRRVEQYVKRQVAAESIQADVFWLRTVLERAFSTEVLQGFEAERAMHPHEDIAGRWEDGAGNVELGYFHRGILQGLVDLAAARLKVDQGEPLTMADIALLLDIREATVVTNAHRKKFDTYEDDNRRYSHPAAALPWMIKNGYVPTQLIAEPAPLPAPAEEDFLFVPAARDNTWFSPDCRISGRYTIGSRGEERRFTDYFAALRELNRMPTPRWRSKTREGMAGIAWGVRFERVRRTDIERALGQP